MKKRAKIKAYLDGITSIIDPINHSTTLKIEISENPEELISQSWGSVGHVMQGSILKKISTMDQKDVDIVFELTKPLETIE